jgi:phosphopantothenate-cysteine ligase
MHRQFSLQPYSRHYSHTTNCFMDHLMIDEHNNIQVKEQFREKMKIVLEKYQKAKREGTLLMIEFITVTDYLFTLRSCAQQMAPLKEKALYYLAAAVSDFFIPAKKMVQHKIQSSGSGLTLHMDQVPKFLGLLTHEWSPFSYVVSFKVSPLPTTNDSLLTFHQLETDINMLIPKARQALEKYGHQLVIANMLNTRKWHVVLVDMHQEKECTLSKEEQLQGIEIEKKIIQELIHRHDTHISKIQQQHVNGKKMKSPLYK